MKVHTFKLPHKSNGFEIQNCEKLGELDGVGIGICKNKIMFDLDRVPVETILHCMIDILNQELLDQQIGSDDHWQACMGIAKAISILCRYEGKLPSRTTMEDIQAVERGLVTATIQKKMKEQYVTPERMAEYLGIELETLRDLLSGDLDIGLDRLTKIAVYLGCGSVSELLERDTPFPV